MIIQLYEILNSFKTYFLANGWSGFYALGQKRIYNTDNDNGTSQIVIPNKEDNYIDISPTDNKGNYAYVRLLNDDAELNSARIGSCNSQIVRLSLRIVGVWIDNNVTDYSLLDKLLNDLRDIGQSNSFVSKCALSVKPTRTLFNANEIFKSELGVDMQQRNFALSAIDFNLEFTLSNCNKISSKCPVDVAPIACI